MGTTWGPPGSCRPQMGPMLAPWTLISGKDLYATGDAPAIILITPACLDDVIKRKHFPRNWSFVWGIHRSRWIPHTKASDAEFDVFFDMRLNKRLSKQPWGWWFKTPSCSLWRQCNVKALSFVNIALNVATEPVTINEIRIKNYP